jgi:hypothetical protein
MAEIGAVASVIQIAQLGAKISITLYSIADTTKSANKDVKRIAKDIALFSSVLKDLGNALERGQRAGQLRGDAYNTASMIVEECEEVFREIETILKKATGEERPFEADIVMPKLERFLWVFKKERIQLLRANLESLKTTILVKLAVLNYAERQKHKAVEYVCVSSSRVIHYGDIKE